MTTTSSLPSAAIILARISDFTPSEDDDQIVYGDTIISPGARDQLDDLFAYVAKLGWALGPRETHVLIEDDTSAFKRKKFVLPDGRTELRTDRPKFRLAVQMLADGRADGLVAVDLDRAARDPRDLEDLIDVIEASQPRIPVASVTGSLKLANDADITMARFFVTFANKSSRDTARRVSRARLRQALEGKFGGGGRRFGFEEDGVTPRLFEYAEIRAWGDTVLSEGSLYGICKDMDQRGIASVSGRPWEPSSVKDILLRPRNAGFLIHQGEVLLDDNGEPIPAPWEPIFDEETWRAICSTLSSPDRRSSPGNRPKHLGSGHYCCGHPDCAGTGRKVQSGRISSKPKAYLCKGGPRVGHVSCHREPLDRYVKGVCIEILQRPESLHLLMLAAKVDVGALTKEAGVLRARIAEAGDMWECGEITRDERKRRVSRLQVRLAEIELELSASGENDPLAGLAGNPDAASLFESLSLERQQAVVDALVIVTILPVGRGVRTGGKFDPKYVRVEPRHGHVRTPLAA